MVIKAIAWHEVCLNIIEMEKIMDKKGFTLVEAMVVIAVIGIAVAVAVPNIVGYMPEYRLKRAARDLYSAMQSTKMGAIKNNSSWAIVYDPGNSCYFICSDPGADATWSTTADNTVVSTIPFPGYGSGINYGHGIATTNATVGGGTFPANNISYNSNVLVFNSRGTGSGGYVYIQNNQSTSYAVGTRTSGAILLRKWYANPGNWI
jgi:type IV fimbrial biogenesis protein FimT